MQFISIFNNKNELMGHLNKSLFILKKSAKEAFKYLSKEAIPARWNKMPLLHPAFTTNRSTKGLTGLSALGDHPVSFQFLTLNFLHGRTRTVKGAS